MSVWTRVCLCCVDACSHHVWRWYRATRANCDVPVGSGLILDWRHTPNPNGDTQGGREAGGGDQKERSKRCTPRDLVLILETNFFFASRSCSSSSSFACLPLNPPPARSPFYFLSSSSSSSGSCGARCVLVTRRREPETENTQSEENVQYRLAERPGVVGFLFYSASSKES